MPDRPKRRKNNKNKRKNKNNRNENSKNSSDVSKSVESCSVKTSNSSLNDDVEKEIKCESLPEVSTSYSSDISNPRDSINCQDLNNNSSDLQTDSVVQNISYSHEPCILATGEVSSDEAHVANEPITNEIFELNTENPEILISESYVVESPDHSAKCKNRKSKLNNTTKSKSLDNDDAPKITEVTAEDNILSEDDSTLAIEPSSALVSDVESDVEWEKADEISGNNSRPNELVTGTLSVTPTSLSVAQCGQEQALTPEAERSLRNYLQTLNLSTHPDVSSIEIRSEIEHIINREIRHRLRKKGLAEDFLAPRLGPPRVLDVIDEEGSSESSITSRRQSHLSDKKSDVEDLDDDVFIDEKKITDKYSTKVIPALVNHNQRARANRGRQIPQPCVLVGTKLKEPEVTEACGDWTTKTVEKMTGAEIVYLTDSSSSTSSIHDFGDETDESVDTDVSVRMITPIIEVSDPESLLKTSFAPDSNVFEASKCCKIEEGKTTIDHTELVDGKTILNEVQDDTNTLCEHEIVVLSTDNIKTNLYVKELNDEDKEKLESANKPFFNSNTEAIFDPFETTTNSNYDVEIKVLKCELNNAFNNLVKEVESDSELAKENPKDNYARQDSSSSVCSSQCTAKYNPTYSSLNDVSNILHDETCDSNTNSVYTQSNEKASHVKDVFECVTGTSTHSNTQVGTRLPSTLRDLCVKKIVSLPYGEQILEELASVSERLQNITILGSTNSSNLANQESTKDLSVKEEHQKSHKMPYYPLPDVSSIEAVSLTTKQKGPIPPPVKPRNSSLKKTQDDHWTGHPTKTEPVYVCLSPSQKMLMEKTNTVITKEDASQLVDMHKKFVDRRGYNEYYRKKEDESQPDNSSVIPFKSQTGSRLFALIRDPNVTNNLNCATNKRYQHHHSLDQIQKSYSQIERMSKRINDQFSSIKEFSTSFKPIPPPRPRKYSSSFYESDESSDFTDSSFRSMRNEKKIFHYSTGNLNKDIENDVSSIQNMHRYCFDIRDQIDTDTRPRRPSLPKDLCEQQMEYIRQKEKEVEAEIHRLEKQKSNVTPKENRGPRAPMVSKKEDVDERITNNNYFKSHNKEITMSTQFPEKGEPSKFSSVFSSSQEEILRDKMYSEYVHQMAAREQRKQQKVIKITNYPASSNSKSVSKSMSALDFLDSKVNNKIEKEFICKARERWEKLGIKDPETEDETETGKDVYQEPKVVEHKIKVIEAGEERDVQKLPNHLQDFVRFTAKDKQQGLGGSGESGPEPASPHVVVLCAVIIVMLAVSKYFFALLKNKPYE